MTRAATVSFELLASSEWAMALDIFAYEDDEELEDFHRRHGPVQARRRLRQDFRRWMEESPRLLSGSDHLEHGWKKSVEDLAASGAPTRAERTRRSSPPACRGS